ncbi:hypothetical protein PPYR_10948 [Photinus pyralis]|uniref:Uncharacterized protein n=1 Tax=Photinus pyralis TaxID=7054 RepID=A0A1Y1NMP3_PHOPY|nr:muscle M-line assembly protein unc-89 isoform X2 [Photinus pyralis]KAB0796887.1 hypothetical protein PPYR_10948 [Photinus pyralis]
MGNTSAKPHRRSNQHKKQVHWKAADRPGPPGKPQLVSEPELTPDVVTIRWDRPRFDGGSPIIGYLVEHRRYGSPHWVRATPQLVRFTELSLSGLEPGWRYQFRVSAENAVGLSSPGELSELLTVTLQRSAVTVPRFVSELSDTVALENEKVEFVSHFLGQPAPKISWYKDGFEIFSSRRIRIATESEKSTLTIHQSSLSDEGEIKCTATNKAGHASTKAQLTLEAAPSIRLPRQYEDGLLFELEEAIRLKVSVAGRPTPVVSWSHNNEPINNSDRYEIENSDKNSSLRIQSAERSDRGEYQIKAINRLGEATSSFLVTVTDKPSPPSQVRVVMTLGKSVTLAWNLPPDDGGCKIGNYIVEYFRLGWDVWLKAATCRQLTTTIGELIEGSEYKFRIKAESPYGISDPSEESDTIFIPDAKRGILSPAIRSQSQPRDIPNEPPSPTKRKPRSSSTTRPETAKPPTPSYFYDGGIPKRPARTKIKSPTLSPEASPVVNRRKINPDLTKHILDRTSVARDLAYGSPEIKMEQPQFGVALGTDKKKYHSQNLDKLPNAAVKSTVSVVHYQRPTVEYTEVTSRKSPQRVIAKEKSPSPLPRTRSKSPSPLRSRSRSPSPAQDKNNPLSDSSEFMLVLLPENQKDKGNAMGTDFSFDQQSIAPPMSLSAPELGAEELLFHPLRCSVSSSELLYENTLKRFQEYAEEHTQQSSKVDIPKIQINSKDNQLIVGLERSNSLRRRSSGGLIVPQHQSWNYRRHSLKNTHDVSEVPENTLRRYPIVLDNKSAEEDIPIQTKSIESKRESFAQRQRSQSEEREEEEFEKIRTKMATQKKEPKKAVAVVQETEWDDERHEDSVSESESDSFQEYRAAANRKFIPEDEDTYHPGFKQQHKANSNQPFEILTKPSPLPDPNFVPKPILKKKALKDHPDKSSRKSTDTNKLRQKSPPSTNARGASEGSLKARSFSLFPQAKQSKKKGQDKEMFRKRTSSPAVPARQPLAENFAPLSRPPQSPIVSPPKRAEEEIRVVVDHYGDIVRSYGNKNRPTPRVILNCDDLKAAAARQSEEDWRELSEPEIDTEEERQVKVERKSSFIEVSSALLKQVKQTVSAAFASDPMDDDIISPDAESVPAIQRRGSAQLNKRKVKPTAKSDGGKSKKSPQPRGENWSSLRAPSPSPGKSSPTAMRRNSLTPPGGAVRRNSPGSISPIPFAKNKASPSKFDDPRYSVKDDLTIRAELKVRSTMDYITDLAMFIVACWLYFFTNELFAIPVLLVMVYRQLKEEIMSWITGKDKSRRK